MRPNVFLIVPLSCRPPPHGGIDPPVLLTPEYPVHVGRHSNPEMLDSLHISRAHVKFQLCLAESGRIMICLTNVRALSFTRCARRYL